MKIKFPFPPAAQQHIRDAADKNNKNRVTLEDLGILDTWINSHKDTLEFPAEKWFKTFIILEAKTRDFILWVKVQFLPIF